MEEDDIRLVGIQRAPGLVRDIELGEWVRRRVYQVERLSMVIDMIRGRVRARVRWLGATFLVFGTRAA